MGTAWLLTDNVAILSPYLPLVDHGLPQEQNL